MLQISDLTVEIEGKKVLDRFCLTVKPGETHAIMGPNGSGKSTLCYALMGHTKFEIKTGKIKFLGKDLQKLDTAERAKLGLFLGFQYPQEVAGITMGNFLRQISNMRLSGKESKKQLGVAEYFPVARGLFETVGLDQEFIGRGVNEGFSGGEKKRAEVVQMAAFNPKLAILDEIDSGLDIDSLKQTARAIESVRQKSKMGLILITHYQRLLHYLPVDFVHVMMEGRLVASGGRDLVKKLEKNGYQQFKK
jgi:Fe-S cluster assembly ATP-binding protein